MDGRVDVRLRAQLASVEAHLCAHPAVARAVVQVRRNAAGDERMVAWVTSVAGATAQPDLLRAHLATLLPGYLVPGRVVVIAALPLDRHGEVDTAALPMPDNAQATPPAAFAADGRIPYLVGIWSQLLGVDVSPSDNFFDLGGHSMLAVQMANRVARDTGARIQLMALASQSLAQVAAGLPQPRAAAPSTLAARVVGNLRGLLRNRQPGAT